MADSTDRQRRIMEHLSRSSGEFIKPKPDRLSSDRKKQIMDHIRQTKR